MIDLQGHRYCYFIASIVFAFTVNGCAIIPPEDLRPPEPLRGQSGVSSENAGSEAGEEPGAGRQPVAEDVVGRFKPLPRPARPSVAQPGAERPGLFPADEPAEISFNIASMPLPAFVNEVFGNELGLDYEMAESVANKTDLVSVRVSEPRNRQDVFEISRDVLNAYGVVMINQGDFWRFVLGDAQKDRSEPPLIVSGRALPTVPESHRPVIYIRTLEVISPAEAYGMVRSVFEREQRLNIQRDNARNALRLQGPPELVRSAANIIDMLDQPLMRGNYSLRIEPQFVSPEALAERLTAVLRAQGYDIGSAGNNTVLVPAEALGALFVFAPGQNMINMIRQWTAELDQLSAVDGDQDGLFWYRVRNTSAAELAQTLNAMMTGQPGAPRQAQETNEDRRLQARAQDGVVTGSASSGSFVVNEPRNLLLFRGEPERWRQLQPLVKALDVAPDQVLIEVVVAEVTLTDEFRFGIEWALSEISAAGATGNLASVFGSGAPGSGLDAGGLSWTSLSSSGQTRLALNAFASSDRVSILQTPRILVRSGENATVKVGSEVPIITRQATGDETVEGTTAIIQDVQFRSTGVQLNVTPRVYSGGRIDIEINQEVSEAQPTQSSNINSPTILTRNVETRLSLEDGSSVLLGGLISNTETQGDSRVPFLGDIPWLGQFFRSDSSSGTRTELMVLVSPYLVRDGADARELTEAFRSRLKLQQDDGELLRKTPVYGPNL